MRINRNNEQNSRLGADNDAFMKLQEKRKYTATHPDAFLRLQEKRKYTYTLPDAFSSLQTMKKNRAKWFKDEPYVEEIQTNQ